MSEIRPAALDAHLAKQLAPVYVVHGDEPLLALEAADAIRTAARARGHEERDVFVVEPGFRWDALAAGRANFGLFGSRKLTDLRIPTGKPGVEGARVLEALAHSTSDDDILLVSLPKLDRAGQNSAWFSALSSAGVSVEVRPVERDALPRWIAERLARQSQRASRDTLAFLADACEGKLLAARQEGEKLAMLLPAGELGHEAVVAAVADVARFDVHALSEAWLAGDAARALRILGVLRREGDSPVLPVWQLGEDLHALAMVQGLMANARMSAETAVRQARVWGRRASAMERAAARVPRDLPARIAPALARLDAASKGMSRYGFDPWDELEAAALLVAGKPIRMPATVDFGRA